MSILSPHTLVGLDTNIPLLNSNPNSCYFVRFLGFSQHCHWRFNSLCHLVNSYWRSEEAHCLCAQCQAPCLTLKIKAPRFFETSGNKYPMTWRHIPENWSLHSSCCSSRRPPRKHKAGCKITVGFEILISLTMKLLHFGMWRHVGSRVDNISFFKLHCWKTITFFFLFQEWELELIVFLILIATS